MREYEFRGKDSQTSEWVYGNLCKNLNGDYGIQIEQGEFKWKFVKTVNIESIGQNTGFEDKNGIEIHDGDFIKDKNIGKEIFLLKYNPKKFGFCYYEKVRGKWREWNFEPSENIEVVGNLYDNPELLEAYNENK